MIAISLFPLSIHAQALTSPFLGINFQVTAYGENMSSIVLPKINIDSINSTVPSGYISGQLNCTSPSTPTSSNPCDIYSFQNTSGQSGTGNGTRIYLNLQNYLLEANGNATINHQSYFFIDYEFILDDNYKGYVTITDADSNTRTIYVNGNQFHYERMQLDTTEKAITIDDYYLIKSNLMTWNIPIESYSIVQNFFQRYEAVGMNSDNYFNYPIFNLSNGDIFLQFAGQNNKIYTIIFYADFYLSMSNQSNVFTFNNCSLYSVSILNERLTIGQRDNGFLIKMEIKVTGESPHPSISTVLDDRYYIPVYFSQNDYLGLVSTDFALRNGLKNNLLNDIDKLANGTTSSNNSASNLDDTTSQFQTDSNSLISIEDSFNSSMNSNLDNINPTFNMGSSFLASANWVSTQFNRIVNNTPFSSLITFGLTLGLGLLIIGKIRK